MPEKTISHIVAANLAYWMEQAEMTQTALAAKAGVSQKTISNYINPEQRVESATGKLPSPKLEELDKIARALAIPVWQLVRQMSEKERKLYEHIERAYAELAAPEPTPPALPPTRDQIGVVDRAVRRTNAKTNRAPKKHG